MFPCLPLLCIVFLFLSAWFTTFKQTLTTNYLLNWVLWKGALKLIYKLSRLGQGGNSHREWFAGALQITAGSLARKVRHLGRVRARRWNSVYFAQDLLSQGKKNPPDFLFFFPVDNSLVKRSIREVNQYTKNPTPGLSCCYLFFCLKNYSVLFSFNSLRL